MTEEQVFLAALDQPDAGARNAYLAEACGDDVQLRAKVEGLLAAHFNSGEFLDVPAPEQISIEPTVDSGLSHAVTIASEVMSAHQDPSHESDSLEFLAPPTRPDSLGRIDHYEVLQVLGTGGFGIVFRAFDDVLQRVVAIKVMAPQMAATSPARKRFLREARTSAQVRHENVVQVYEVGEQPLPYLVMEFIPGETLQQRIDRMGPLDVPETLRIGRQIAEGLAAAHATDLIHRDIKPGNVLLEGGQHKVKITDFGLARAADDASMTQSGQIAGTPMYMAPEQALGETLDQRVDLFSLGSVLYQMVAGRPPFRANTAVAVLKRVVDDTPRNIREVIPETPQWLCDIIAKLHAKKPEDRYQSAREVADVLADCEAQLKQGSKLRDFSRIPRSRPAAGHFRWGVAAALVLFSLLILAGTELTGITHWFRRLRPNASNNDSRLDAMFDSRADGFVPLFNGKDLTGWKTLPGRPGKWTVENGVLEGRAPPTSYLFSERGDYQDFHLRAIARANGRTDSGVAFRAEYGNSGMVGTAQSYEVDISTFRGVAQMNLFNSGTPAQKSKVIGGVRSGLFRPEEWFAMEIIARGNTITLMVNGQTAATWKADRSRSSGHIALQAWSDVVNQQDTVIQFRRIEIKELPASPPAPDGFVALFNGTDLTGWKPLPEEPGHWEVKDGILVGSQRRGVLLSERGDFADFHLRVQVKINLGGDSGILFRAGSELPQGGGYEAEIHKNRAYARNTGTIEAIQAGPPIVLGLTADDSLTKPDEWFELEVIAEGGHFITKINGQEAATCTVPANPHAAGHIGLQVWNPNTVVQFRKIEIKELPATPPPADGFVELFNGQDLTGWKKHSLSGGDWKVVDGVIDGRGTTSYLFSDSGDYDNFHLRVEAKINGNGDAGVCFRTPYDVKGLGNAGPARFALLEGYEASIAVRPNWANHTGSLTAADGTLLQAGPLLPHKADEWFVLEVIADGNRIRTLVDGKPMADCVDESRRAARGHIALQTWGPNITSVQFRKIEIKERPAGTLPSDAPPPAIAPFDAAQAKAHQSTMPDRRAAEWALGLGGTVQLDGISVCAKIDELPEESFRVTSISLYAKSSADVDLSNLEGLTAITALRLDDTRLTDADLVHLRSLVGLQELWVRSTSVTDAGLVHLKHLSELKHLDLSNTKAVGGGFVHLTELKGLKSLALFRVSLASDGLEHLKHMKGLTNLDIRETGVPEQLAQELHKALPACKIEHDGGIIEPAFSVAPFTDADVKRIAALPAEQQVAAVVASLKERNPGLNGTASHKIVDGVVTEFNVNPTNDQNALTDVSPVRALMGLKSLNLWGCVGLEDLEPLKGMKLTRLIIGSLDVSLQVRDLEPLKGMKLTELQLYRCQVQNLEPLQDMPLTKLTLFSRHVRDCGPLTGLPLTTLGLAYCSQIEDFTPLADLPLTGLHLNDCQVRDLEPFKGMQLTELLLAGTPIRDLELLKGMPLKKLSIHRTGVTDLTPLQGMELDEIYLTPKSINQGLKILREMKSLKTIGIEYNQAWPAAEFWERYDMGEFALVPFTDADAKRIAALPAAEQVEEVRKELIKRNPGFDGTMTHKIENGVVTELSLNTDEILDISPVRALTKLVYFDCRGTYPNMGKLSDLSPLKGMAISRIDCSSTQVGDLTPLAGLPLTYLHFNHNPVSDLAPLKGMPLQELGIAETKVSDLSPLKGMQLKKLGAQLLPVTDLSPLAGMPLTGLDLYHTVGVTSLEPLRGMPLDGLNLQDVPVSDLSPLKGMSTLRTLLLQGCKVSDLSPLAGLKLTDLLLFDKQIVDLTPLKGLPLTRLHIYNSGVSDLRPVQGMPLVEIRLNPKNITQGLDILRETKTLQTIGIDGTQAWPAAEFWERLEKGEFK